MSSVVQINNLWKRFPGKRDMPNFKEFILHLPKYLASNTHSYFWALKGVSLHVKKGECIGIIGRNGAGKSTLLSVMLGTIYPTKGEVKVHENITPLLELGGGFCPELTGRENVLINGVLMGLTKDEVLDRMDDIIAFSQLEQFIDMPARTYSTGMYLRLAFSIAIHTDPRLLLIDEVLAVGDEAFQKKSEDALMKLIKGGSVTTVLVTHNLDIVKDICNRAIWLDGGEIRAEGEPEKVVEEYLIQCKATSV